MQEMLVRLERLAGLEQPAASGHVGLRDISIPPHCGAVVYACIHAIPATTISIAVSVKPWGGYRQNRVSTPLNCPIVQYLSALLMIT